MVETNGADKADARQEARKACSKYPGKERCCEKEETAESAKKG